MRELTQIQETSPKQESSSSSEKKSWRDLLEEGIKECCLDRLLEVKEWLLEKCKDHPSFGAAYRKIMREIEKKTKIMGLSADERGLI